MRAHPGLLAWAPADAESPSANPGDSSISSDGEDVGEVSDQAMITYSPQHANPRDEMSSLAHANERWDVYYHQYLLHTCLHREMYWYKSNWWFPEPGRNEGTLPMFTPSRSGIIDDIKYYDMNLPDGTVLREILFRYVGEDDPYDAWLQDYIGYNMNLVTVDMVVLEE